MSEFEELLINEINKFPCIFDKKNWGFKNKLQREKAWAAVAGATKYPIEQCQGRWKTLRERFVKEVHKEISPSGSAALELNSNWKYMASMDFMRAHVAPRTTISSIQLDDVYETVQILDDSFPDTPQEHFSCYEQKEPSPAPPKRKRKAADSHNETFDELCTTMNSFVQSKCSNVSRNDAFLKYLDSILLKASEEAQDEIKIELINLCSSLVKEKRYEQNSF